MSLLFFLALSGAKVMAATVWLDDLDVSPTIQDWGEPHKNQSVEGHGLTIGGQTFTHGLGTHAKSVLYLNLKNAVQTFSASVGVDGEITSPVASIEFFVVGDGKILWQSGVMKAKDAAKQFTVNVAGVKTLLLKVGDTGDGNSYDHADWADAKFETVGAMQLETMSAPAEAAIILTPPSPPQPRINGAEIFGVRPGSLFLFTIAATGNRPMTFSAANLPEGLRLDPHTGQITGSLKKPGEYIVTLGAKNDLGSIRRKLKIVVGDTIALTPPMGWNSWNCFAQTVSAEKVKAAADAMVKNGLINHGWTYINVDDFWQNHRDSTDPTLHGSFRDAQGNVVPNSRFPDMKGMADYIHGLGLKAGLYSSPGPWTCGGCTGSWQHEQQDAAQYAAWGFDYLKYDLCSYHDVVPACETSLPLAQQPYRMMGDFLKQQPRDIIFSLCQYGELNVWQWGGSVGGNCWRTTGDISDSWGSMSGIGFRQDAAAPFARPGNWNDPDMLIVGKVGWGHLHPTRLTPNEQYTHVSLWCLLSAPLLIGCDMTQLDPFTLNLLENDEVLAVDQDPLGKQAMTVSTNGETRVYAKDLADGSKAVGLFNLGEAETQVHANWSDLGLNGKFRVRDLWRQKDLGEFENGFSATVPRHGVVLIKVSKLARRPSQAKPLEGQNHFEGAEMAANSSIMNNPMSNVDWAIIAVYLLGVVGLGVAAGFLRRKNDRGGEGGHYFLAGNTLAWPVIGLAMFAANISTVHLVSLAEAAYKFGLVFGNFEWMAGFTLILLSLFFAPLYLRSKVATLPDFLERRFNRGCRDVLSVVSLFSAIIIHMGVALYTAAWVLRGILGLSPGATILGMDALMLFIVVLGLLTGIYTMAGGLLAVVWTESLQTVLLLVGAIVITAVGYQKIGGWTELAHTLASHPHPLASVTDSKVTWGTGNFLNMARNAKDPSGLAWYSILLGYPVLGIWYWCCDQTIVQRVLAAKDERHARLGPLFCAFLKIWPVFFFVLPGVICVALVQKNVFNGAAPATSADTYTFLITHLLPIGLKGLVAAAMLAAAMQTCSAALNSTATLVAYDLFKRHKPDISDHKLVTIGKITTVVGTILAIIASPLFGHYTTIFEGINKLISYVAPPITAVFVLGVFWKRASGKSAFITLVLGMVLGLVTFLLDWNNIYRGDFMLIAFFLLVACLGIMIVTTFLFPEQLKDEARLLVWENWREPLRGEAGGRGLGNYRVVTVLVLVTFVALYFIFR